MPALVVAEHLDDALARLAISGARPIAGGVGLMLARARGDDPGGDLVAVGHLPELLVWEARADGGLELGAGVRLAPIAAEVGSPPYPPLLARAARAVANPGIRAVATIGGNIVDGAVLSDLAAALIALDARLRFVRREGERTVAMLAVPAGPHPDLAVAAGHGSLLRSLVIPPRADRARWGWARLTLHGEMDRSAGSVAVTLGAEGARVALSAAVAHPMRLASVEAILQAAGRTESLRYLEAGLARRLGEACHADLEGAPIIADGRAPAAYRRRVIPVLVVRAVRAAIARGVDADAP